MQPTQVAHLQCKSCDCDYLPQAVVEGEDGHWYIVGKCPQCKNIVGTNIEMLYARLYAAHFGGKGN